MATDNDFEFDNQFARVHGNGYWEDIKKLSAKGHKMFKVHVGPQQTHLGLEIISPKTGKPYRIVKRISDERQEVERQAAQAIQAAQAAQAAAAPPAAAAAPASAKSAGFDVADVYAP